jgi:hypothetical protein
MLFATRIDTARSQAGPATASLAPSPLLLHNLTAAQPGCDGGDDDQQFDA